MKVYDIAIFSVTKEEKLTAKGFRAKDDSYSDLNITIGTPDTNEKITIFFSKENFLSFAQDIEVIAALLESDNG